MSSGKMVLEDNDSMLASFVGSSGSWKGGILSIGKSVGF